MADVHPAGVVNEIWPGQDYNNVSKTALDIRKFAVLLP